MQRSVGTFIVGIAVGIVISFAVASISRKEKTASAASSSAVIEQSRTKSEFSPPKSNAEENKILLGDIATVPFQELYELLSSRSSQEMAQLVQQLNDLPPGRDTDAKIAIFFKAWAHLNAKAALTAATSLKSLTAKGAALEAVIEGADATVAGALVTSLNELPQGSFTPAQQAKFIDRALTKWSEIEPVAAAKVLDALPKGGELVFAKTWRSIAQNWAASDPQAAVAWVQGHGDSENAKFAMSGAIAGWWEKDPRAAETYVASHLDSLGAETAMMLASRLFNQDPQGAKDWVSKLPNVDARRRADSLIAMRSASTDPRGASEWAASLPDDAREPVLFSAVGAWARKDPTAAAQWVNTLVGTTRDEAASAYSFQLAAQDPVAALSWATGISEVKIRDRSVQQIVTRWLNRSPSDARAWIQGRTLPDAEKMRLLALPVGK